MEVRFVSHSSAAAECDASTCHVHELIHSFTHHVIKVI